MLTKDGAVGFGGGLGGPNKTREVGRGTAGAVALGVEGPAEGSEDIVKPMMMMEFYQTMQSLIKFME